MILPIIIHILKLISHRTEIGTVEDPIVLQNEPTQIKQRDHVLLPQKNIFCNT